MRYGRRSGTAPTRFRSTSESGPSGGGATSTPKALARLEIEDELELGRLHDWQVGRL